MSKVRTLEELFSETELQVFRNGPLLDSAFRWRTKTGEYLKPIDMETRHLFYTLRMIWNHSMPFDAKLRPYNHYNFGPFYTPSYVQKAIICIGEELMGRTDLKAAWIRDLHRMAQYLHTRGFRTEFMPFMSALKTRP